MSLFTSQKTWKPTIEPITGNGDTLNNLQKLTMGAGSSRWEANISDGMWLGADTFATAPFSVDFLGNLLASSVTIKNSTGSVLIDSDSSTQDFVQVLNSKLNTETKKILSDFDFGTTDYAGAVKSGDITWNSTTGAITGGSGVVVYRGGILGAKAGVAQFTLNASTGDATFAGTVAGASGTFGTVTAGTFTGDSTFAGTVAGASGTFGTVTAGTFTGCTFTGNTFQSALAGLRVQLDNTQYVKWYDGNDRIASIGVLPTTDKLTITADGGVYVAATGSGDFVSLQAGTGGLSGLSNGAISFNASSNFNITCDDCYVYYNDDNDSSDCIWVSNTTERMKLDQSGNLTVGAEINALGNIQCGGTFESSDGTDGVTEEDFRIVTWVDSTKFYYRNLTWKDGILTHVGGEEEVGHNI